MTAPDLTLIDTSAEANKHAAKVALAQYEEQRSGVTHVTPRSVVRFEFLPGGWLLYTCLWTAPDFKSANYALRQFTADNGVTITSKNSPVIVDAQHLALQGAFLEFNAKPSLFYVGDVQSAVEIVHNFKTALTQLGHANLAAATTPKADDDLSAL